MLDHSGYSLIKWLKNIPAPTASKRITSPAMKFGFRRSFITKSFRRLVILYIFFPIPVFKPLISPHQEG
jgi:hypothetical protein